VCAERRRDVAWQKLLLKIPFAYSATTAVKTVKANNFFKDKPRANGFQISDIRFTILDLFKKSNMACDRIPDWSIVVPFAKEGKPQCARRERRGYFCLNHGPFPAFQKSE